jgi:FixJ family two-component response regulator
VGSVFVVDDDASVRDALSSLLRAVGWQVRSFASAIDFLRHERAPTPSCMVLDVRLPGVSGLELQRMLAERGDRLPVIFMTGYGDIPMSVQAMKAGALEFLSKPFRADVLLAAVEAGVQRDASELHQRAELAAIRERIQTLSAREREVMDLVVKGMLNKQAAARLTIAEATVKVHRRHVMEKMGTQSLPDLVRMVERVRFDTQ